VTFPNRWRLSTIGEAADTALGKMLDRGKARGMAEVPYLRNVNVQWGRIDTEDVLTMELQDGERDRFQIRAGDLLVCEGGEIGRAAIWPGGTEYMAYQKALHRLRPRAGVDARFLRYLFEHHAANGTLAQHSTGSTIAHLPQQRLREVPVPLPRHEEQRQIVDILEDHLSRLDAAERDVQSSAQRLEALAGRQLRHSLAKVSSDDRALAELLRAPLANGRSVPTRDGGFPVLRLTALKETGVDLEERKGGAWSRADAVRFLVERGDYLIARGNGSLRLVGRGSLVRKAPDEVAYPDTAIRARPRPDLIDPEFLDLAWNSSVVRTQIESMARTTAGIYKVNQQQLGSVRLPVPSLEDQVRIKGSVGELRVATRALSDDLTLSKRRSRSLRRALLRAAFSGRLTGHASDLDRVEEMAGV